VITGGTGAFAHDTGRGTAFLTLLPDATPFHVDVVPIAWGQEGRFQLRLAGAPPREAPVVD
jgi:hypothetical protein